MQFKKYPRHIVNLTLSTFVKIFKIICSGGLIKGQAVGCFERNFSTYIGSNHSIAVFQARVGFIAAFKALGLGSGDEVLLASYNYHIIPEIIMKMGMKPIFVDVDSQTYTIDPNLIQDKITPKTKAIIVTHMFGQPADIDRIVGIAKRANLKIIEDCAHALGAEYSGKNIGSFGDLGIFSFATGKAMPCIGGGMVVTDDAALSAKINSLLLVGRIPTSTTMMKKIMKTAIMALLSSQPFFSLITFHIIRIFSLFGWDVKKFEKKESVPSDIINNFTDSCTRMSNIQGETGLIQLKKLDGFTQKRVGNAALFSQLTQGCAGVQLPAMNTNSKSAYLYYDLRAQDKIGFKKFLVKFGIDSAGINPMSDCSSLKMFKGLQVTSPIARQLDRELIEIPNNYRLRHKDIEHMATVINNFNKLK